jgi:hypothetical protein
MLTRRRGMRRTGPTRPGCGQATARRSRGAAITCPRPPKSAKAICQFFLLCFQGRSGWKGPKRLTCYVTMELGMLVHNVILLRVQGPRSKVQGRGIEVRHLAGPRLAARRTDRRGSTARPNSGTPGQAPALHAPPAPVPTCNNRRNRTKSRWVKQVPGQRCQVPDAGCQRGSFEVSAGRTSRSALPQLGQARQVWGPAPPQLDCSPNAMRLSQALAVAAGCS